MTIDFCFCFCFVTAILQTFGMCNMPLVRYFGDILNGILHATKFLNFELLDQKIKFVVIKRLQIGMVKRNEADFSCGSFWHNCFASITIFINLRLSLVSN